MGAGGANDVEFFDGFGDDARAFFFGEGLVSRVFEQIDALALVVVADPTFESDEGAGMVVEEFSLEGLWFQRLVGDSEIGIANCGHLAAVLRVSRFFQIINALESSGSRKRIRA